MQPDLVGSTTMEAAVFYGTQDIRVEQVDIPDLAADEVLLRVRAVSICGTDLRTYSSGHFRIPPGTRRILGHELAGEIAAIGSKVGGEELGQRVTIAPDIGCGTCYQCIQGNDHVCANYEALGINLDGAFAEYMRVPARAIKRGHLVAIPVGVSFEEAALIEPFSCCYNGSRACRIEPGDAVLVIGAGPIGIMHVFLARLSGARQVLVSEMSDERLNRAVELGADLGINPTESDVVECVMEATSGRGADVVIVAAPSPSAQEQALQLAAVHGRINFFGGLPAGQESIHFNSNLVHYRELTITGTTGSNSYHFRRALEIVASGQVDLTLLVGARFPLSQIHEALALAADKRVLKVVVEP